MARIPEQIITPQQLTTSNAVLYTVPVNRTTIITRISLTNTSATDRFVDLHLVPSGSSVLDSNKIVDGEFVAAGETLSPIQVEGQVILESSTIQGSAEANSAITIIGSGTEVTN